jgi:hypothetical protein
VPTATDTVRVQTGTTTITGMAGSVCDLTLDPAGGIIKVEGSVDVTGMLRLGVGSLTANTGASATPALTMGGGLTLAANVTVDGVAVALSSGSLELAGRTLNLVNATTLRLANGATVASSAAGGLVVAKNGATAQVDGAVGVLTPATVQLQSGATLSGGASAGTLGGTGVLHWQAGTLAGNLTTQLQTVMDGTGTKVVAGGGQWTNAARADIVAGTLQVDGILANSSTLRLHPGAVLTRAVTAGRLDNTGTLAAGASDVTAGSGWVRLSGLPLTSSGTVTVASGVRLLLQGDPAAPAASTLAAGSVLSDPVGGTTPGVVQVGAGSSLTVSGASTLQRGLTLRLDDETDGGQATLTGAGAAALTGQGAFDWRSGVVAGPLDLGIPVAVSSTSATSRRLLTGALGLGGTSTISGTTLSMLPAATVAIGGSTTLSGDDAGFTRSGELTTQRVSVSPGGTLRRSAPAAGSTVGPAVVDVPLVNAGSVSVEAPLDLRAGFSQGRLVGSDPATTPEPVTSLLGGTAHLRSIDTSGAHQPLAFAEGGLGGIGTISATGVTFGTGWLHPGLQSSSGRLLVEGGLTLNKGSDVQIVLRGTTDTSAPKEHDLLQVAPLVVGGAQIAPGSAALAGKITGVSTDDYAPAYGTRVEDVVTFTSRTGSFESSTSLGTPNGLGWRPAYDRAADDGDGLGVDLRLSDVAPPALGLANLPAFTQARSVRLTYAAVDNRTGVKNYDVRWRVGSFKKAYGDWHRPKKWQHTKKTSRLLDDMRRGRTYCFSVRVRDRAGNRSAWTDPLCTARMLDDRAMTEKGRWAQPGGRAGFYNGTFSRSSQRGATLKKRGTFTRIAVTAVTCPTCGKVQVRVGKDVVKTIQLDRRRTGTKTWVSKVRESDRKTVRLVVASRGKPVVIDSFGLVR